MKANMKIEQFKNQMIEHGFDPGEEIRADGQIHRFSTWGDKSGETSGSYWHNGKFGWYQDWRTMEKPVYSRGSISASDKSILKKSFADNNGRPSLKALQKRIKKIWAEGTEPEGHPYLIIKGIKPPPGRVKQYKGRLIIPMFDINGKIQGLATIDKKGRKKNLYGSRKKGSFGTIPGNGPLHLVLEGWATGVSLFMATGANVIIAFDKGNLEPVVKELTKRLSSKEIIVCGDNDFWKLEIGQKNVGADSAKKAAASIGARYALPKFKNPDSNKTTDWNDLHRLEGLEEVKRQILSVPPVVEFITLAEISEVKIEDDPIIEGLLGEKESGIISAASGVGKSLISNQIALTCANPPENGLWGLFKIPKPVKTLIVQSENGLAAVNRRLVKLFNANPGLKHGASNVFMLHVNDDIRLSGCLTDLSFQALLIEKLKKLEAKLLILDPLVSYHEEDENSNSDMRTVLDCLTSICDQSGASVLICHHFNRKDLTRGAAAIRDWCANHLVLNLEQNNPDGSVIFKVVHDKSRNYRTVPDFYQERTTDLQFLRCQKPGKRSEQIEAVIKALTEMGGSVDSQAHLKNALQIELNCTEYMARKAIEQALEMRKILIIPAGKKGLPNGYKLPESV